MDLSETCSGLDGKRSGARGVTPIRRGSGMLALLVSFFVVEGYSPRAAGSERRFTYTYGSDVLPARALELEPWTTIRYGRDAYYLGVDNRLELEFGITDRLQTALYANFRTVTDGASGTRETESEFSGVSSEWKVKLTDPVADAMGSAAYFEVGLGADELELEAKAIFDKRVGKVLTAMNLVFEYEWEGDEGETVREGVFELDLGAAYFLSPAFSAGLELRNHNEVPEGKGLEHSAIFAGPAVSYASDSWWAALTVLPQVYAPKRHHGNWLDLMEHEKLEARFLFGVHI